jgi:tagatose 6-phosphate kinase
VLLVVCPNLGVDRILEVDHFQAAKVQRSRSVFTQPGGKGSNVARVFRQLGGDVVLAGFVGAANTKSVIEPLRRVGVHVEAVVAFPGESRTCTIVCDRESRTHPTVINEETPEIERRAAGLLETRIRKWLPRVEGVLTTGSLSTGLPIDFYARILDEARLRGKRTAIDAARDVLRAGLYAHPDFAKPNAEEFSEVTAGPAPVILPLAAHTAVTLGRAGAVLIHKERNFYSAPPAVFETNPIGAGDSFVAAYLRYLLRRRTASECFRFALAAAASDASTLRPGFVDIRQVHALAKQVELRFL